MATITGKKVGVVNITATYDGVSSNTVQLTVEAINLNTATVSDISTMTYTGSAMTPTPTVTVSVGGVTTTLVKDTDYTLSYSSNTNAGTATVTISAKSGSNYTGSTSKTWTIQGATITVNAPAQSYTYNKSAQGVAITATTVNSQTATITYSTDGGTTYTSTVPTATNVSDSKTIYYKVTAPNHKESSGSYSLSITKATPVVTMTGASTIYPTEAVATASSDVPGTIYYGTSTGSTSSNTGVIAANTTVSLTGSQQGVVGTKNVYAYLVPSDTGNYNNSVTSKYVTVTVSNGTLTINATPYNGIYNGSSHNAITSISTTNQNSTTVTPTYTYSTDGGSTYSSTMPTVTNVTSGTSVMVKAVLTGYTTAYATVSAVVTSGTLTVTASPYSGTYDTTAHNGITSISAKNQEGTTVTPTFTYSTDGSTYSSTMPTVTNYTAGTKIYWKAELSGYTTSTGYVTAVVNKATPSYTLTSSANDIQYHNTANITASATVPGTLFWGESSTSMTNKTTIGTTTTTVTSNTAVGTKTIYTYFVPTDSTNYNSIGSSSSYSKSATAKIIQSTDDTISVTVQSGLIYTGSSQVLATVDSTEGVEHFTLGYTTSASATASDVIWGTQDATTISASGVGTYYIWYKYTPDGNHSTTETGKKLDASAVISNSAANVTATAYTGTYDGTSHNAITSLSATDKTSGATVSPTYTYSTDGTNYTSTMPTLTDATTGTKIYWLATLSGYANASGYVTVVINKKAASLVGIAQSVAYGTNPVTTFTSSNYTKYVSTSGLVSGHTVAGTLTAQTSSGTTYTTTVNAGTSGYYMVPNSSTCKIYSGSTDVSSNYSITIASTGSNGALTITRTTGSITYTANASASLYCTTAAKSASSTDAKYTVTAASSSASGATGNVSYSVDLTNWEISTDGKTLTVPSGLAAGTYTAKITATSAQSTNYEAASVTRSVTVTVNANTLTSVTLTIADSKVKYGSSTTATVSATYSNGASGDVTSSSTYSQSSSDGGSVEIK